MDKKKLIGTIIGVFAFAALIAGATYAWLTFNLTVNNGTYNLGSMNFSVVYSKGTDVTEVPIVTTPTTENTKSLSVTASKASNSAPGDLTIYLNTTAATEALLTTKSLHYTVCVGTCTNTTDLSQETNTGTVDATGKLAILTGTPLQNSSTTYNIYFWLDNTTVDEDVVGATYSGYISAEALQVDTR